MATTWPHGARVWAWLVTSAWVWAAGGPHLWAVESFNLSPAHHKLYKGPVGAQFGFSVALWSDVNDNKRVVVGAPRGKKSSVAEEELPLGNVYYCEVTGEAQCTPDLRLPMVNTYDKSHQALHYGTTLRTQGMGLGHSLATTRGPGSPLTVCAPRYPRRENDSIEARGACFVLATHGSEPQPFVFYPDRITTPLTLENGMFGFSVAMDSETDSMMVGGPNAYNGRGFTLRKTLVGRSDGTYPAEYTDTGDILNMYEGWAVTLGNFDQRSIAIAVSSINYGNYSGKVTFYPRRSRHLTSTIHSVYGRLVGAGFGYSLGSGDVDGDGAADLLVGSPLAPGRSGDLVDAGRVFLYFAPLLEAHKDRPPQELFGRGLGGRFGLALTILGDLNRDGYQDVAVAAPYGGEDKQGIIYIYNGGSSGLTEDMKQTIRASDFAYGFRGFGTSLDGGIDMDNNGYPDLVIGAAHSDTALFIRSAPVVVLVGGIKFLTPSVTAEDGSCNINAAGYRSFRAVCFSLTFNFTYNSYKKLDNLRLRFRMLLEGREDTSQFGFRVNNDHRYTVDMRVNMVGRSSPWSLQVFTKRDRSNIGLALRASVGVTVAPGGPMERVGTPPGAEVAVPPVMDVFGTTAFTTNTTLVCSNNHTCFSQPDMVLSAAGVTVTVGEGPLVMEVVLEVRDDPAYSVEVKVQHPEVVQYMRVSGEGPIPECKHRRFVGQAPTVIVCSLPFLQADAMVMFSLVFNYSSVELLREVSGQPHPSLPLRLEVTSDSEGDTDTTNNKAQISVNVTTSSILYTKADARPETLTVVVNQTATNEDLQNMATDRNLTFPVNRLGPLISHHFSLTNRGPSPVMAAKLVFHLPLYLGSNLATYFTQQPSTSGPITCTAVPTNPLGLLPPDEGVSRRSSSQPYTTTTTAHFTAARTPAHYTTASTLDEKPPTRRRRRQTPTGAEHASTWTTGPLEDLMTTYDPRHPHLPEGLSFRNGQSNSVQCLLPECTVTCEVGLLQEGESVHVTFTSYLVIATVNRLRNKTIRVLTWVQEEVEQEGSTVINPMTPAISYVSMLRPLEASLSSVPLWVLLLAVVVSALLIFIIIAALWKFGFFKRQRPPTGKRESPVLPSDGQYMHHSREVLDENDDFEEQKVDEGTTHLTT